MQINEVCSKNISVIIQRLVDTCFDPSAQARWSGVVASLSLQRKFEPSSIRSFTMDLWPYKQAMCSAVIPW